MPTSHQMNAPKRTVDIPATTFMRHAVILIPCLVCLPAIAGCANLLKRPAVVKATPQNPAAEIVGLWQPAKGPGQNGLPSRGMAGRLMFFTRGNAAPVVVDGDVRIYLFDNDGPPEAQARPIHQFDFRAEDWPNFLQSSTLGPTYNLFIPYVRGGHKQVECTLQVRFSPKTGPAVYSDLTTLTLPGSVDSEETPAPAGNALAAAATRIGAPTATADPSRKLSVHTIAHQRGGGRTMAQAAAAPSSVDRGDVEEMSAGPVRQASYAVEARNLESSAGRIAELEELVKQLQSERAAAAAVPSHAVAEPRRLRPQASQEMDRMPAPHPLEEADRGDGPPAVRDMDETTQVPRSGRLRLTRNAAPQRMALARRPGPMDELEISADSVWRTMPADGQ